MAPSFPTLVMRSLSYWIRFWVWTVRQAWGMLYATRSVPLGEELSHQACLQHF